MKISLFLCALVAAFAANAQQVMLGGEAKGGSTNRVVTSKTITEKAWTRDIVTVDELGQIHGDSGVVARDTEVAAIGEVADESKRISNAALASMNASMDYLLTKTNNMATAGLGIALAFAPETDDPNLRGFVVDTETIGGYDYQWVHYNAELSLPPNRFVTYETYGTKDIVKCDWIKPWEANGTNIVVSGRNWSGCHRCRVPRPTWAQGKACLEIPNEIWGGDNGMDWGSMTLTHGGVPYYTGYVTNSVDGLVAYFDNGFLKEIKPVEE